MLLQTVALLLQPQYTAAKHTHLPMCLRVQVKVWRQEKKEKEQCTNVPSREKMEGVCTLTFFFLLDNKKKYGDGC